MTETVPTEIASAKEVKLLLMDCDGVMTDGRLYFSDKGEAMKVFHVRDGQGLANWHKAGLSSGIISGRGAEEIIRKRAEELSIAYIRTNSRDKVEDFRNIIKVAGVSPQEVAFVGDDIGDVDVMKLAGFAVAVGDACNEAKAAAVYITFAKGGHGAIREVTDLLLAARGLSQQ
ncbi:MAG: KdsC family phosphatase [Pyrinomonadaceae bacterium]